MQPLPHRQQMLVVGRHQVRVPADPDEKFVFYVQPVRQHRRLHDRAIDIVQASMDIDDHFARAPLTNCLEHRADVFHQRRASLKSDCQSRRDLPVFQERVPRILVADFLSMIRLVPRIVRRPANRDGRQESVAILVHREDMVLIPFLRMRRDLCR